jgi:hypothetical protein
LLLIGVLAFVLAFAVACGGGDDDDDSDGGDDDGSGATATLDAGDDDGDDEGDDGGDDGGSSAIDVCGVATAEEISAQAGYEVSDTLDTSEHPGHGCNWDGAGGAVYVSVWVENPQGYYDLWDGEPVDGLGHEAQWLGEGVAYHSIKVLTDDYMLDVVVSASDSVDEDRERAIALSELMLERIGQ